MDVARLNFSHGTHDVHKKYILYIRRCGQEYNKPIAVLQDLQGIKIRIGIVENGAIMLKKGQKVLLKQGNDVTTEKTVFISYPPLLNDLNKGQRVLFDDGLIELKVTGKGTDAVEAVVKEGGLLTGHKGVNLPESEISLTPFTDKDRDDLDFGIKIGVDAVALSFVTKEGDIRKVKDWLNRRGVNIPIIAKIEKPEAVMGIDSILDVADGIMVARGDLGVEVPPQEVPIIQKELIRKANARQRLVIIATQMLESMREHLRPTRAEATDVANAVIDGTDGLMLSAETSIGKHPVKSVRMMKEIIEATENNVEPSKGISSNLLIKKNKELMSSYAVTDAAVRAANDVGAKYIVVFTRSGFTGMLVSKCRPNVPIIAFTPELAVMRQMSLYWGIRPLYMSLPDNTNTDEMVIKVQRVLLDLRIVKTGDVIVIIASSPLNINGKTNFMKIHKIER